VLKPRKGLERLMNIGSNFEREYNTSFKEFYIKGQ
jgi:hypothetical protein